METPIVVQFDHDAPPPPMSPLVEYLGQATNDKSAQKNKDSSTTRKQVVDMKNYKEIKQKYQGAKKRVDRLKQERENNKRMLLEMSSVISALKDISIEYEPASVISDHGNERSTSILNIHNKIRAVDTQLKTAMIQCGNLEQEKELQTSTIMVQQHQIKEMEAQIHSLRKQLTEAVAEESRKSIASEKKNLDEMNRNGEVVSVIQAQEGKIAELESHADANSLEQKNKVYLQIEAFRGSHRAKYAEIQAMERQLQALREAQRDRLPESASRKNSKPVKHVTFTPCAMQFKLDREKSHSHSSGSSTESSSSTHISSISDQQGILEPTSEEGDEEEGSDAPSDYFDHDIFADERGANYSLRSAVVQGGGEEENRRVKVVVNARCDTSCEDESVEITMNKSALDAFSEQSYTSDETISSRSHDTSIDYAEQYNKAAVKLMEMKLENENLRKNHRQALANMAQISELTSQAEKTKKDYEELKRVMEEQKQANTLAQTKYVKMVQQHGKLMEDLKEERAKYAQLLEDYSKTAHCKSEIESYDKLEEIHNQVVMKLADLGEENERLLMERDEAWKQRDAAESKARTLASEKEAANNAYKDLKEQNDSMIRKVSALSITCDEYKTKYYEVLACDQSMSTQSTHTRDERYDMLRCEYESVLDKLREVEARAPSNEKLHRDNSEALAKITVLEQTNQELEGVRGQYHAAEAKIVMMERAIAKADEEAKKAKHREEQRALHLKDMLSHYKTLEAEHEEVCQKLQRMRAVVSDAKVTNDSDDDRLQLGPAGLGALAHQAKTAAYHSKLTALEQRIKGLQQQRDAAVEQMSQLEEELSQARLEKAEAVQSRKEREQDLKVVLGHYRDLQTAHDELNAKTERLEQEMEKSQHTAFAVLAEKEPEAHRSEIFDASIYQSVQRGGERGTKKEPKAVDDGDVDMISESPELVDASVAVGEPEATMTDTGVADAGENDSVARLLIDMDELKRQKESRRSRKQQSAHPDGGSQTDEMSSVSNVTEGVSLDNSHVGDEPSSVLSDEAPSTTWKDVKIAKLLSELEEAKTVVSHLLEREKSAQAQLEITERKLLVASREASDAQKRQSARECNLRDAIAQQQRLQGEYEQVKELVSRLKDQLEQAKTKARLAEEETKAARKRATGYHNQFKKLQEKHNEAMKLIEEQECQIEMLEQN
jgi:hypothetical protein